MNLGIYEQGISHDHMSKLKNLEQIKTLVERLHQDGHIDSSVLDEVNSFNTEMDLENL